MICQATVILQDCLVIAHVLYLVEKRPLKLGELVKGPGVDYGLRLKSMP